MRPAPRPLDDRARAAPAAGSARRSGRRLRPAWPGELLAVAFLLVGYDRVADLSALHVSAADGRGRALLRLETGLHIAVERSLDHAAATHAVLDAFLSLYYDLAHGLVTVGVLVGLYVLRPAGYRRARTALVAVNVAALGVFLALPVTPPRLLSGADVVDVVAHSGTWGALTTGSAVARHADQYASMPSLHVAWALWVVFAVLAMTRRRSVRSLALAHLGITVLVVLSTGNHYVLDAVAGALLTAVAWAAASWLPVLQAAARARLVSGWSVPGGPARVRTEVAATRTPDRMAVPPGPHRGDPRAPVDP